MNQHLPYPSLYKIINKWLIVNWDSLVIQHDHIIGVLCVNFPYSLFLLYFYVPFALISWASLVAQLVKNPPAMPETWVQSLSWEDPLEKGKSAGILSITVTWVTDYLELIYLESSDNYKVIGT